MGLEGKFGKPSPLDVAIANFRNNFVPKPNFTCNIEGKEVNIFHTNDINVFSVHIDNRAFEVHKPDDGPLRVTEVTSSTDIATDKIPNHLIQKALAAITQIH